MFQQNRLFNIESQASKTSIEKNLNQSEPKTKKNQPIIIQ